MKFGDSESDSNSGLEFGESPPARRRRRVAPPSPANSEEPLSPRAGGLRVLRRHGPPGADAKSVRRRAGSESRPPRAEDSESESESESGRPRPGGRRRRPYFFNWKSE